MKYKIVYRKKALKFLQKQTRSQQLRIIEAIEKIPRGDIVRVATTDQFRLRVGDVRILFKINNNELIITVINIGSRGQIYNNI